MRLYMTSNAFDSDHCRRRTRLLRTPRLDTCREGYSIGLFGRSRDYIKNGEAELRSSGHEALAIQADITEPEQVGEAVSSVREQLGPVSVLAHTASTVTEREESKLDPSRFERLWRLYAHSGLLCFREVYDDLVKQAGTVLLFGPRRTSGGIASKSGKDATRGLARGLVDEYGPDGIHVAHVIIAGRILNPDVREEKDCIDEDDFIDPEAAAETCLDLISQPPRCRTFELDLHARSRLHPS